MTDLSGRSQLLLIRHGEAEVTGAADLTDVGREQARALAERLRAVPIDRIVASPMKRALATAEFVGASSGLEVVVDADLQEFGIRNFTADDVVSLVGRLRTGTWAGWQGESPESFRKRAASALDRARSPGGMTAVVTHGGFINAALCLAMGRPFRFVFYLFNTSVTQLVTDGIGIELGVVNDVTHLGDQLLSPFTSLDAAFARHATASSVGGFHNRRSAHADRK